MLAHHGFVLLCALCAFTSATAAPLETSFNYRGQLAVSGAPADGLFDFSFALFDTANDVGALSEVLESADVSVINGSFSVELDFTADPFAGDQLWLEIGVRESGSTEDFVSLSPRQKISAVPYALHAEMVAIGAVAGDEIADNTVTAADLADDAVGAAQIAAGAVGTAELATNSVASAQVVDESLRSADLAVDSVTRSELAAGAVTSEELADGAVRATDIDHTEVQRRVYGSCDTGTYLSGINQDGTVRCGLLPISLIRTVEKLAVASDIAMRPGDLPIIVYRNSTNELELLVCTNPVCTAGSSRVIAEDAYDPAIALGANGIAMIAYTSNVGQGGYPINLYVCSDTDCTDGSSHVVAEDAQYQSTLDIAVRVSGFPTISYREAVDGHLNLFSCADATCGAGVSRSLTSERVGIEHSLAIRPADDTPIVSYQESQVLRVYRCSNPECSSGRSSLLDDSDPVYESKVVVGGNGLPLVAYTASSGLKIFRCAEPGCVTGSIIDADIDGEFGISITVRPNGLPMIAYISHYPAFSLRVLDCLGSDCATSVVRVLVDDGGTHDTSIASRHNGGPLIGYAHHHDDPYDYELKLYSCGDEHCQH